MEVGTVKNSRTSSNSPCILIFTIFIYMHARDETGTDRRDKLQQWKP